MRIISNFKDYYDFMVSKYGIDPKIVYNRVPEERKQDSWQKTGMYKPDFFDFPNGLYVYTISFCGIQYLCYYIYGDWYHGSSILEAKDRVYPVELPSIQQYTYGIRQTTRSVIQMWQGQYERKPHHSDIIHGLSTTLNDEMNCPIIVGERKNPRLSDFQFGKIIPPEDAFITISNWLSREKHVPNNQTNKEKIVSHGFDLKTSFRNM